MENDIYLIIVIMGSICLVHSFPVIWIQRESGGMGDPATSSTMPNSLVGAGGLGGSMVLGGGYSGGGGGMQGLSGQQNMVYQVIHQYPHENGVSRSAIYGNLSGKISQKQIELVQILFAFQELWNGSRERHCGDGYDVLLYCTSVLHV